MVPGQLAKLATVAGATDLMAAMGMGEDGDDDGEGDIEYEDGLGGWVQVSSSGSMDGGGGAGPPGGPGGGGGSAAGAVGGASGVTVVAAPGAGPDNALLAMRPKSWDGRECDQCGLQIHETDARFCRRCGDKLGLSEAAGPLFVRRPPDRKKTKPVGSNRLPFRPVGRLGLDPMGRGLHSSTSQLKLSRF